MEEPTRVAVWCFCFDSESDGSFSFFFPDFLGNLAYVKSNGYSWLGFVGLTSFPVGKDVAIYPGSSLRSSRFHSWIVAFPASCVSS